MGTEHGSAQPVALRVPFTFYTASVQYVVVKPRENLVYQYHTTQQQQEPLFARSIVVEGVSLAPLQAFKKRWRRDRRAC